MVISKKLLYSQEILHYNLEGCEMMKEAKSILLAFIVMLICCSYSLAQPPIVIGVGGISGGVPGTIGMISDGAGVFPAYGISNGMAGLAGNLPVHNIVLREFVCNSMSACGLYSLGKTDNTDGAKVFLGGAQSGASVSGIDGSAVKIV